ncbi:MAG: PilN domain-containing protein [Pseudomonadota bacterium]
MRKTNLLPWREELRQERQKSFLLLLFVVALGSALFVFMAKSYFDAQIEGQGDRNEYLQEQIAELDRQIERIEELDQTRSRLIDRKNVIEDLQANRSLMVHLFDQLVRTVPTGIRLTNVRQIGDQLTINGMTQSSGRVSTYLRNLDESDYLHNPSLQIIQEIGSDGVSQEMPFEFGLTFTLASPDQVERDQDRFAEDIATGEALP